MLSSYDQQREHYNSYSCVIQKVFLSVIHRCTAGLNRASNAIAIDFVCGTSDNLTKYKAHLSRSTCSLSVGRFVVRCNQVALVRNVMSTINKAYRNWYADGKKLKCV